MQVTKWNGSNQRSERASFSGRVHRTQRSSQNWASSSCPKLRPAPFAAWLYTCQCFFSLFLYHAYYSFKMIALFRNSHCVLWKFIVYLEGDFYCIMKWLGKIDQRQFEWANWSDLMNWHLYVFIDVFDTMNSICGVFSIYIFMLWYSIFITNCFLPQFSLVASLLYYIILSCVFLLYFEKFGKRRWKTIRMSKWANVTDLMNWHVCFYRYVC